jgi:hypothetical protein
VIDQRSRGGPVEILSVDWADPRASALRAAMDVEMTAAYGSGLDRLIPEAVEYDILPLSAHDVEVRR